MLANDRRAAATFGGHGRSLSTSFEDGIPEIAQARRMGHRLPGVRGIYSHVTEAMEKAIADALQHRWPSTSAEPVNLPQPWNLDDPDLAA